jgi:hypothetical protein
MVKVVGMLFAGHTIFPEVVPLITGVLAIAPFTPFNE